MKHGFYLIIALVLLSTLSYGQELQKTRAIHLQGGTANAGLHIGAGMEKFWGRSYTNSFLVSLNYQRFNRSIEVTGLNLKEQDAFLNLGYRKYIPVTNRFLPYIGASVLAGWEHLGYGASDIYEHHPTKKFIYGAGAHIGAEYRINPISFFVEGGYIYDLDNTWTVSEGIKYYF